MESDKQNEVGFSRDGNGWGFHLFVEGRMPAVIGMS